MNSPLCFGMIAAACACILGCDGAFSNDYTFTRQEPAVGRRSPTTFTIRLNIDSTTRSVSWLEDVHDSDGELGRNMKTWEDCTFFDSENWECAPSYASGQGVVEQIQMRDGKLFQRYWSEERTFRTRRRLLGLSF